MRVKRHVAVLFFNDTATTEIYTLSLHDALPISGARERVLQRLRVLRTLAQLLAAAADDEERVVDGDADPDHRDRKSTRLNSSHANISYAVFCLKTQLTSKFLYTSCTRLR